MATIYYTHGGECIVTKTDEEKAAEHEAFVAAQDARLAARAKVAKARQNVAAALAELRGA